MCLRARLFKTYSGIPVGSRFLGSRWSPVDLLSASHLLCCLSYTLLALRLYTYGLYRTGFLDDLRRLVPAATRGC